MIVAGPDNPTFRFLRGLIYVWIAVLVLALDPRTEDPATPIKHLISAAAAVGAILVWAIALRRNRVPYRGMNPPLSFLFLFFLILVTSAIVSGRMDRGLQALSPWVVFSSLGFVVYQVFPHTRHLRELFRVIVASVSLSSIYGLAQHLGWDPFPWANRAVEEYRALPATYGNPNLAGHALVIALVLWAGLLADAWQRKRWSSELAILLAPGALMATHLSFTQMRGGLLALGMAGFFVLIAIGARRRSGHSWRVGAMALSISGAMFAVLSVAMLLLASALHLDSSLQLRLNGYQGAVSLFLEKPIFGVGPGNYAFHNIPHWTDFEALWYALESKRNFHAHNEWLEMAAECGIPGLAAFIGVFLFSIVTFFDDRWIPAEKHRALFMAIPAAMAAIAADACFGFNLHAPVSAAFFFLLIALRPARPFYSPPIRRSARRLSVALGLLTLSAAWVVWADYGYERRFQQAQGAVAWERDQRDGGTTIEQTERAASLLEALTESRPGDYRGWMLRGDFALSQGETALAVDAFGEALAMHPHLPRLHVQRARALIRAAQEEGADAGPALDAAQQHAEAARERCPELAEAWAMLGWCFYVKTTLPALNASDEERRQAVEYFQKARDLGLSNDANIDAALGECHARLEAWSDAARAYQRCVGSDPANGQRWMQWHEAATRAGGNTLAAHQQSLLHHLGQFAQGNDPIAPELATWVGGRIAALAKTPAQVAVAESAFENALERDTSLMGVWSARMGLIPEAERKDALSRILAALPEAKQSAVSPVVLAVNEALTKTSPDSTLAAATALAQSLATAPGLDNAAMASIHAPLVAMLGDNHAGAVLAALGAARFECGNLEGAEAALRASEATLPADALPHVWYYRSRTLFALGQFEAALQFAKAALDGSNGQVEYQWQLARCLTAIGHGDAARFAYESLRASLAPDHPYRPAIDREYETLAAPEATP